VKYSPDENGYMEHTGYGYVSLEKFIDAAQLVSAGKRTAESFERKGLPTIGETVLTTAILNAGRISLDENRSVKLDQVEGKWKLV
jgi:D-galacturonate reductase